MVKSQKSQQGSFMLILVVGLLIAGIFGLIYFQQTRLEAAKADLATSQAEVKKANDALKTAATVNKSLEGTIETMKNISKIQQEERTKLNNTVTALTIKTDKALKKLPTAKPKDKEPIATLDEIKITTARAEALWEAFCTADATNTQCLEETTHG